MQNSLNAKQLANALSGPWLIDAAFALNMQELLPSILNGSYALTTNYDKPFRVDASGNPSAQGPVMVVPINGPMMKFDNCGSPGTASMADAITAAQNDNSIKGIVLSIDSPGGSVDGTEELARTVATSRKKVVAFAHSNMASAAYWVGSQASEIVVSGRTTKIGSIGTMAFLQKADSSRQVTVYASRSTRKNKSYEKATAGETQDFVNEYLDPLNNVFEAAVSRSRSGKIDLQKEDVLEGAVYIGNQAIKVGLADKMGSFQYAVKQSLQQNIQMEQKQFESVQAAANVPLLTQIEEGYVFDAEAMQNIENALAANATAAAQLQELTAKLDAATEAAQQHATQMEEKSNEIAALQSKVQELESKVPPIAQTAKTGTDVQQHEAKAGWEKYQTSVDAEAQKQKEFLNA